MSLLTMSTPASGRITIANGTLGNARSLGERAYGAEIDAADLVIRINRAPMPAAASRSRTRSALPALLSSTSAACAVPTARAHQASPA